MIDFALIVKYDIYENQYKDLALDENGNFIFVQGADCVNQMIETALRLFIGEYEYNTSLGIAWDTSMQAGYEDIPILQYQAQQAIYSLNSYINDDTLQISDVQQTNFTFDNTRRLTLNVQVQLGNGEILGINVNG